MSFDCAYCGATLHPLFECVRCKQCGAVSHADGTPISPRMIPIPADGEWRASPWMLPYTRPVVPGMYECRFHELGKDALLLQWTGSAFMHGGKRVRDATLSCWRGQWAT